MSAREHYLRWTPYLLHMSEKARAQRMLASAEAREGEDIWKISVEERLEELERRVGDHGMRLPKDRPAEG